jgi:hypothetical protein
MNKNFSVVIPTMWKSNLIHQMLPKYETCYLVKEVIIIDNDPNSTPNLDKYSKVRHYTKGTNIYVNPAWNFGVSMANYRLILANDDILIADITDVLTAILNSDFDIVGTSLNVDGLGMRIKEINTFPIGSYGCFMYVRNYVKIPEPIKIWCGDRFLFANSNKKGILMNGGIHTNPSTTLKTNPAFKEICKNDRILFSKLYAD